MGLSLEADGDAESQVFHALQHLLHKGLQISAAERRVVLATDVLSPARRVRLATELLLRHFKAAEVVLAPSPLCSLLPLSLDTALIVDLGCDATRCIPVVDGHVLYHALSSSHRAMALVRSYAAALVRRCGTDTPTPPPAQLDRLVRACVVESLHTPGRVEALLPFDPSIELSDAERLAVQSEDARLPEAVAAASSAAPASGFVRAHAFDVLFAVRVAATEA